MSGIKIKYPAYSFVIIGCGNLAWHLAKRISKQQTNALMVINHKDNADLQAFKEKFNCTTFSDLKNLPKTADFYFICVSDKAIPEVVKKIKPGTLKGLLMHCAGSQPLSLLGTKNKNAAVFYPLQTFSKSDKVQWSDVPVIIEAANTEALLRVRALAQMFSRQIITLTFDERLKLHLAAVLVNNFVNALFIEAYRMLPKINDTHIDLLYPLIKQTVSKLEKVHPLNAQTGPAKRRDENAMNQHLKLLKTEQRLKKIYVEMSALIMAQQKNTHD